MLTDPQAEKRPVTLKLTPDEANYIMDLIAPEIRMLVLKKNSSEGLRWSETITLAMANDIHGTLEYEMLPEWKR